MCSEQDSGQVQRASKDRALKGGDSDPGVSGKLQEGASWGFSGGSSGMWGTSLNPPEETACSLA